MISTEGITHLRQLEAESIHIMREVVAEFNNPAMLYSVGKDSAVMLHLAQKAEKSAKVIIHEHSEFEVKFNALVRKHFPHCETKEVL